MSDRHIPFNKPFIAGKELFNIARAVIENGHTSGDGPFSRQCQDWLEQTLGCKRALLTHSCTAALEAAAILSGVGPGDEVIMPSFTFVSTANAFVLRGATPVFVDICEDTLNMDPDLVARAVTDKTRAVVPVHYAGTACDMDAYMALADKAGLLVIEDAAQALLSTYKGRQLGAIGHLGCLSFHETKNIICGEGGALLVNDERYVERAEIIVEKGTNRRNFYQGMVDKYSWVDIGSSYLPSDILAGFLFAQFNMAEDILSRRCRIFDWYYKALEPLEAAGRLRRPMVGPDCSPNGHLFYMLTATEDERGRLIAFLAERGITAVFHYVPLHSSRAGRQFGRAVGPMAMTDVLSGRLLRLPIYYDMEMDDVRRVVRGIYDFYSMPMPDGGSVWA